jgi:hypothetical protein
MQTKATAEEMNVVNESERQLREDLGRVFAEAWRMPANRSPPC